MKIAFKLVAITASILGLVWAAHQVIDHMTFPNVFNKE